MNVGKGSVCHFLHFRFKETCSEKMYLLPSDNFEVTTAPNIDHYECKFTIHLPVGKRVDLRIWNHMNETVEIIKVKSTWVAVEFLM